MKLSITAKHPFNFESVVRSHGWSMLAPYHWDADTGILERVEELGSGKIVLFALEKAENGIAVEVRGRLNKREQQELSDKISWMFSLDLELGDFYAAAAHEPRLAHVKQKAHGRFLRSSTVWEDVVKVMMTTNIQWSGTKRLTRVLVETFGDDGRQTTDSRQLNTDNSELKTKNANLAMRAFPKADVIARTRETRLRKLGLGYRSPYLLQLARGVAAGKYDLESLKDATRPTDEVRQELLALPGIGPYAAATMLMILGRYEYLGVDTEALSAVSRGFFGGKRIGEKEVQQTFAGWGKFKAIAYWFWDWEAQFAETERETLSGLS